MSKRKTIDVDAVREKVNKFLKQSTCSRETRLGAIFVLDDILHDSGNYKGYGYLTMYEIPEGEKPGIIRDVRTMEQFHSGEGYIHDFPDDSRRFYY